MRLSNIPVSPVWLKRDKYRDIYSTVPRLSVALLIRTPKGIILAKRGLRDWYGQWHLPGGCVSYRESIEAAACRLANRELGIGIEVQSTAGYIEYPSELTMRDFEHTVDIALLCRAEVVGMKPNKESLEIGIFSEIPPNMIQEQADFIKFYRIELVVD